MRREEGTAAKILVRMPSAESSGMSVWMGHEGEGRSRACGGQAVARRPGFSWPGISGLQKVGSMASL